jgi:REP element-mobilizing transposase RayT
MQYNPKKHYRRSLRLKGYDYSGINAYFITICTQNRECLFGDAAKVKIRLNDAGVMVFGWWNELNRKFPAIETDSAIVMPNHFRGIINNVGATLCGRPDDINRYDNRGGYNADSDNGHPHRGAPTLGDIVGWFKTMTTNEYIRGVKQYKWRPFPGKLWQRNYYEHIIKNEKEINAIREYILRNPYKWDVDTENPDTENFKQWG